MRPGTDGVEIHPSVAPANGEPVIEKAMPNSFVGTGLEDELRSRGIDELVVAGMMSSMCVDAPCARPWTWASTPPWCTTAARRRTWRSAR